jgi:hypothetical protein
MHQTQKHPLVRRVSPAHKSVPWWLRVTSSEWQKPQETIEQREQTRRSELLSWILLALFIAMILFIPTMFTNFPAMVTVLVGTLFLVLILFLNRAGRVTLAGVLLVIFATIAVFGVIVGSPDGKIHLYYLPAYDFLVVAVILGASILPRISAFIIAGVNIFLIYANLLFQQKTQDLITTINIYGLAAVTARPIVLLVVTAFIAYLWVRGMENAVRRADRAEELRRLEHYFIEQENDRVARAEEFVAATIKAINLLANGQEGLVELASTHPWQQQAQFINTQLKQFHKLKQANRGNVEYIAEAAELLYVLLQRIQSGQITSEKLGPKQFYTQVPIMNEIARLLAVMLQEKEARFNRS